MTIERTANEADTCRAGAVFLHAFHTGCHHIRMVCQPKVVVAAQHENFALLRGGGSCRAAQADDRPHRAGELIELLELPGFPQLVEYSAGALVETSLAVGMVKHEGRS